MTGKESKGVLAVPAAMAPLPSTHLVTRSLELASYWLDRQLSERACVYDATMKHIIYIIIYISGQCKYHRRESYPSESLSLPHYILCTALSFAP